MRGASGSRPARLHRCFVPRIISGRIGVMSSNFSVREVVVFGIISREKVLSTAFSQSMAAERFAKRVAVCIYVFLRNASKMPQRGW